MIRWRFYEPNPMRQMLEQMIQASGQQSPVGRGEMMPINIHQTDSEVVIEAALPGVLPDDIDVSCSDGLLSIRAAAHVEEREYFHQEIHPIEYHRQVALPVECRWERADASFENGMLMLRIPRQRPRAAEKIRIQVSRGSGGSTTIEAARGEGYTEVRGATKKVGGGPGRTVSKKPSAGGSAARKPSPGSRSEPAR